jgi:hypothetical protein
MPADGASEHASPGDDRQPPAAVFRNSLRGWQAQWKAQQPGSPAEPVPPKKIKARRRKGRGAAGSR